MTQTREIGILAAELMERIEAEHPGAEIGEVIVTAEVILNDHETRIESRWSGHRPLIALALLRGALESITRRHFR